MKRLVLALLAVVACTGIGTASASADTFGLFVSGLGGDDKYSESFLSTGRLLYESAVASGMQEEKLHWLAESSEQDRRVKAKSTRDAVLASLADVGKQMRSGDLLWFVLIGHGSHRDGTSKINLPGPDLSDQDLREALARIPSDRAVVLVNTASASGGFLKTLSGNGRVVVTATKSAGQRNLTVFGAFFAGAFLERRADNDQDGFVSVLEAFVYANEEVKRHYDDSNLLISENALLDDNGDGVGSLDPDSLGGENGNEDGIVAARLVLGASALSRVESTPENVALLERKSELQGRLDALRRQKNTLNDDLYFEELQSILVEIAKIDRRLRRQSKELSGRETSSKQKEGSAV